MRTKRVLIVLILAVAAATATKCLTHFWRCSAEADYEYARTNLKRDDGGAASVAMEVGGVAVQTNLVNRGWWQSVKDSVASSYRKGADAVNRPYRETRHMVANMPEYIKALIVFQLATVVDAILVWIVIALFLLKVLWWAAGKLFNAWIDGPESVRSIPDSAVEILANGDAVIHVHKLLEK